MRVGSDASALFPFAVRTTQKRPRKNESPMAAPRDMAEILLLYLEENSLQD